MSKLVFGLIAFAACFITLASAGGGAASSSFASASTPVTNVTQIQYAAYTDSACTQLSFALNFTSGNCYSGSLYSPDATNSFVYVYGYASGSNCSTANITYINKIQAGVCGGFPRYPGAYYTMLSIYTDVVNPVAPTAFPPPNFIQTTEYLNTTDSTPDNTCSSTRTVVAAYPPPQTTTTVECQIYPGGLLSYQKFLDTSCTTQVYAYYSDSTCTNVVRASSKTVTFKACDGGFKKTCTGTGIPSFPTLSIGYSQFDNNQCITNSKTRETVAISGSCFSYQTLTCGMVNGTQMLTATSYKNADCTGGVTSTDYVQTGICSQDMNSPNITATCTAAPIGGTSSSTGGIDYNSIAVGRSVSIVSIMIGMIIGFITIEINN